MDKTLKLLMAMVLLSFSASASALLLGQVGVEDDLVDWANLSNSGAEAEAGFFTSYLGYEVTISQLDGSGELEADPETTNWVAIDDGNDLTDLWAYYLNDLTPDLFLVKTGSNTGLDDDIDGGSDDLYSHFLYENNVELGYAVIDLFDYNKVRITGRDRLVTIADIDIFRISHVTVPQTIPEPGIIGLLAMGLLGVGAARRRIKD